MITCNLMGGLGNQIFQIFTTISYAIKSKNQFKFLNIQKLGGGSATVRYTFWETFFSRLKPFLIDTITIPNIRTIREKGFTYENIPIEEIINKDINLFGYFQSYKYFQDNFEIICKMIGIERMKCDVIHKVNFDKDFLDNTISMHFRLGDYKKIQEVHPLATYKYYEESLTYISNKSSTNTNFTIFIQGF